MHVPHDQHAAPLLGAHFGAGADAYYRLAVPLGAIGGVVAPFLEMTVSQVGGAETMIVSRFGAAPGRTDAVLGVMRMLRRDGGRVLCDFDDDTFGVPANVRDPALNMAAAAALARASDGLICTNATLASRLRRLHRDVRIVPNYINVADWPEPAPPPDGPVTIALAGSASHINDWPVIAPALARLKAAHAIRLRVCGPVPPALAPLVDEHRPWGPLADYPAMLAGAHIGLCPLPDTGFNRCKSPIKAYEYALAGLAVVASPCQYGPVLAAAGVGDFLVADARGDWATPIARLVTDPAIRQQAAVALRTYVREHLDARCHTTTIRAAYAA